MAGGQLPFGFAPSGALTTYQPTLRERATDWLRTKLFTDDREGQQKAGRVMDVATYTPFGFATDLYDAGREGAQGNYGGAALTLGMAGLPGPSPKGIRAFHGSPHDFDRFDMSKIGTGEGAQAYGHGLYFAENEGVARGYRDALTADRTEPAKRLLAKHGGDVDAAMDAARKEIARLQSLNLTPETGLDRARSMIETQENNIAMLNALKNNGDMSAGRMYEVQINADPEAFLDWDKPLSEQPEAVRKATTAALVERGLPVGPDGLPLMLQRDPRGEMVNASLTAFGGAKNTPELLQKHGIAGIKYLDAGSRGAAANTQSHLDYLKSQLAGNENAMQKALGNSYTPKSYIKQLESERSDLQARIGQLTEELANPTRNYVVFDDKLISIVRKYGIAGASAMLGYNILDGMDEAQAAELKRIEGNQ